jgi:hypothetical protein
MIKVLILQFLLSSSFVKLTKNFIEKAIMSNAGQTEEGKYNMMTEAMNSYIEKIDDCATTNPLSKFALA